MPVEGNLRQLTGEIAMALLGDYKFQDGAASRFPGRKESRQRM
jgi:hypothetical protein